MACIADKVVSDTVEIALIETGWLMELTIPAEKTAGSGSAVSLAVGPNQEHGLHSQSAAVQKPKTALRLPT
jgi:hypothetical protein